MPLRESGDKGSPTNVPDGSAGGRGGRDKHHMETLGRVLFSLTFPFPAARMSVQDGAKRLAKGLGFRP